MQWRSRTTRFGKRSREHSVWLDAIMQNSWSICRLSSFGSGSGWPLRDPRRLYSGCAARYAHLCLARDRPKHTNGREPPVPPVADATSVPPSYP